MKKEFWKTKKFWAAVVGLAAAVGVGTATQYEWVMDVLGAMFGW